MNADPIRVPVGHEETPGLLLTVHGRTYPGAVDQWDGNWLRASLGARASWFSCSAQGDVRVDELVQLRSELQHLYEHSEATASLEPMEPWFWLQFKGDGFRHVDVALELSGQLGEHQTPPPRGTPTSSAR